MSVREDAREWFMANCLTCGRPFGQEEAWMDQCPVCFKEQKGYKLLKGDLAFACLQYEVERLRAALADAAVREDEREQEGDSAELQALREQVQALEENNARLLQQRKRLKESIATLEGEVERLRRESSTKRSPVGGKSPSLELPLLRKMLLLCHPDTNPNNVAAATEVTQWLLEYKTNNHR
jgi:hypothetical protein